MAENLIIYYSRRGENNVNGSIRDLSKGNTEYVAEFIQKAVGGDLFEVQTVKEYSPSYMTCIEEAKKELRSNARPELKKYLDDISAYDNIFICGPCWWGIYPMAIYSLTDRLDFAGKKVMAVVTHEGSGLVSCEKDLKKHLKGDPAFGRALAVHGADAPNSEQEVSSWARKQI
jgi:flavodoxin